MSPEDTCQKWYVHYHTHLIRASSQPLGPQAQRKQTHTDTGKPRAEHKNLTGHGEDTYRTQTLNLTRTGLLPAISAKKLAIQSTLIFARHQCLMSAILMHFGSFLSTINET